MSVVVVYVVEITTYSFSLRPQWHFRTLFMYLCTTTLALTFMAQYAINVPIVLQHFVSATCVLP